MAYFKKNRGRRFGKRRWGRGIRRTGRLAYRRTKRFVRAVVRRMSEVKYSVAGNTGNFGNSTPFITDLTPNFAQGTTKTSRIGDRIRYKYIQIRFTLVLRVGTLGVGAAGYFPTLRILIFWTRIPLPAQPGVADILDTGSFLSTIRNTAIRVVYDKLHMFSMIENNGATGATMFNNNLPAGRVYKRTFAAHNNVSFRNATDVLPQDPKDRLYMAIIPHSSLANAYIVDYSWFSRFTFIDV